MGRHVILTLFLFNLLFMGCQNTKENAKKQAIKTTQNDSIKVISKHFNNNAHSRIEWKIPVVRNDEGKYVRQGTAVRYTVTGNIAEKVPYIMNKKEGKQLNYYPNGKVYLEQTYKNGKLNGECKLYDRQGILMAKYEYLNNMPAIGLVEYTMKGKAKPVPELTIDVKDELKLTGKYILNFRLTGKGTDRIKSVKYYQGKLYNGKYLRYKSLLPSSKNKNKKGKIVLDLPPHSEFNHTLNIVAVAKTYSGLKLILQKPVSVHICKL